MKNLLKKMMAITLSLALTGLFVCQSFIENNSIFANVENDENLVLDKSAKYNTADDTYTLTLNAYTKGSVDIITRTKPSDIVLVLDQSGSMNDDVQPSYTYAPDNMGGELYTCYMLTDDGNYVALTYKESVNEYLNKVKYYFHIFITPDGREIVPLDKDGKNPSIGSSHGEIEAIEIYTRYKNPVTNSKKNALITAAKQFVDSVQANGGDHRIAVVGFAGGDNENYLNTELKIGTQTYRYGSDNLQTQYENAFQSMSSSRGYSNVISSINTLKADGATRADLGLEMAEEIYSNDSLKDDTSRNKVVIMFTDGEPTSYSDFDGEIANASIAKANELKAQEAKVFTIGVVESLDNTLDPSLSTTNALNRYMQYVSSNYPSATSLNDGGYGDFNAGYFSYATDQESLNSIFSKIKDEITSTTSTLDENTILKDYITDSFTSKDIKDIKVYTQKYRGFNTWAEKEIFADAIIDFDQKTQCVSVSGFNYKDNYITDASVPTGSRLVLEITIRVNDGFIGGNNVTTNKDSSGIYIGEEIIKSFDVPQVNIPINFSPTANDTSMYITQTVENADSLIDADGNLAGLQYKDEKGNVYTFDGIQNKYADVTYEVRTDDDAKTLIGTYTILAGQTSGTWTEKLDTSSFTSSTKINVSYRATPSEEASKGDSVTEKNGSLEANVNVFKPYLDMKDDVVFLGRTYDLNKAIHGDVSWKCLENEKVNLPSGNAPTVSYAYSSNGKTVDQLYKPSTDSTFAMKVFITKDGNKMDVTESNTITNNGKVMDANKAFCLKVVKGELQITKNVDKAYTKDTSIKANQTFIFKITVYDETDKTTVKNTYYQSIDFDESDFENGKSSKTITINGLEAGIYEVSEETNWSWKYILKLSSTNYKGNANRLYIGDADAEVAGNNLYFGLEQGTTINGVQMQNPGTAKFLNEVDRVTNVLGDTANAINKFIK